MKIGRNEPCPCGSGKKYKNCCLNRNTNDIIQLIRDAVKENHYSDELAEVLCKLMQYMKEKQWIGACHATAAVLYVVLSEMGYDTEICVGEVGARSMPFDHSWVIVDKKIIDLACYMTLLGNGIPISNPVVLDTDVVTKQKTDLVYGIETGLGLDQQTNIMLQIPFTKYLDEFPGEDGGLWTVIQKISKQRSDISTLRNKYMEIQRRIVKGNAIPKEWINKASK